ncbi:M1 family metallopeptidase [uncultured Microscilla sp.]|uniref:M1 family metallopeptidase n=1 Tax=uncultured Microscilla sp. TaxID=432653 RepID=UPI00260A36CE|nr:M1 family metallopeptidase [uncultured Microscilla sp.]
MKNKLLHLLSIAGLLLALVSCGGSNDNKENSDSTNTQDTSRTTSITKNMELKSVDVHTFAKAKEAVMTDLALDIKVDFDNKIITGKAIITLDNKAKTDKLYLDTKELGIDKVTIGDDEKEAKFTLESTVEHLGNALVIDISPDTKKVTVYYQTNPQAEALQWLSPQQTAGKKHPFLFTQSQAILARSWVPCQDSPGIRFTYSAKVTVPKDLMALMSAENPTEKNAEGVYNFKMPQPIPAYLLALSVGDLAFGKIGERTGVYAEPSMLDKCTYEFANMEKMLEAAEGIYGKYEWGRYDVIVLPPSFPFGGMENPRLTFATPTILAGDRSLTSLIAHELAHSWSGNLVTNNTWNDFWLNEGFTVFFERKIMGALRGESYAEMLAKLGLQDLQETVKGLEKEDTKLKLALKGRNPDDGMNDIAYEKGYFFLRLIAETVGKEKFDEFLKNYFAQYKFQSMDTEGFLAHLKQALPEATKLNLDEWVYQPGLPANCPKVKATRFENIDKAYAAWEGGKNPAELDTKEWSTHEWLHFLRKLPTKVEVAKLKELDATFKLTQSGNSEIAAEWLSRAVPSGYNEAYPALEKFLINVGRRKFLVPLYKSMITTEEGKALAKQVYAKARPNYHSVSYNTIDKLLK